MPPSDRVSIFAIENPWLFRFDVYVTIDKEIVERFHSGSLRPFNERPLSTPGYAFPLPPGSEYVYVFDAGESAANYPVVFASTTEYSNYYTDLVALLGMYYGVVIILVLYNLALFFGTRDKTYLVIGLYAACLVLYLSVADGLGAMFVWPNSPELQQPMLALGWSGLAFFLLELSLRFLNVAQHSRRLAIVHRIFQVIGVCTGLTVAFTPSPVSYTLLTAMSPLVLSFVFGTSLYFTIRRLPGGLLFLIANGMFVGGGLINVLMIFAVLDPQPLYHHSIHIGSVLELALFSIALSRRLQQAERARWNAYRRSEDLSRRNKELHIAKSLAEEHRMLQKSLQQAQKLKTLGQLAGGFAHDFNNILASILGFTELAKDKRSLSNQATLLRYLDEIEDSGRRGANLVKQLLVYSRNAPPEPQQLNLVDTLTQAQELLRGSLPATVEIETHLPANAPYMYIDPEQIQQVLVNLSINAAEAMHNRGKIDLYLDSVSLKDLTCTSCMNRFSGDYVALKIEDSGNGITGNVGQLFTPFHTTKSVGQGTGLGLSVVHGIVHEHGGHIHAGNRADGGARFTVYLPQHQQPRGVQRGKRVLLIEDDPSVAKYLETLLRDNAFTTTHAALPTQALETFVANPNGFDLVITDHLMPQGTGLELAEDIHALRPELPVILTTGNPHNIDANDLASAGISSVFEKPLNSEQLVAKIHGLLAS